MKVVYGDLIQKALEGEFDVIIHGCNCFHTMGAGIARTIRNAFPEAYKADLATANGDSSKLGSLSVAKVTKFGHTISIVNAYTQFNFGSHVVQVNYDALRLCFSRIKRRFAGQRIGYPRIGAGLAGGDWSIIAKIIDEELLGEDHTLVEWRP